MSVRLNIGCGKTEILDGWVNMDVRDYPGVDFACDVLDGGALLDRFGDSGVDEFYCGHMFEHLTGHEFLRAFENLWFIAKDGARMTAVVPYGMSSNHWRDPDHVRPMFHDSFNCLNQPYWTRCDMGMYEFADWQTDRVILRPEPSEIRRVRADRGLWLAERALKMWNCVAEMAVEMHAVKPARAKDAALGGQYGLVVDVKDL